MQFFILWVSLRVRLRHSDGAVLLAFPPLICYYKQMSIRSYIIKEESTWVINILIGFFVSSVLLLG